MPEQDDASSIAYARLQPEQIIATLEGVGYRCDGRFLALNSYENRVYQIGIEDGAPVVAKFYRPARWSNAQILEEHSFASELAAAELPVVAPTPYQGKSLLTYGPYRFAVYPYRGGRAPELDDFGLLRQLGRLVARIHNLGELANFVHRPAINIESYGIAPRDFLLDMDFIPRELIAAYESTTKQVLAEVDACLSRAGRVRQLRIHADFHPGNVLIAGEQIHIVDLDDARRGPAVQDLWMFLSGNQAEQCPQLSALLAGYEEFRRFDARELHLIEALRSLRIMHYAAWLARRWDDPAFKAAFPWFAGQRYWDEHILTLREQVALMQQPPLAWRPGDDKAY
ncbi:MAG: serine/threonine protein kinase [Gammaproteobacteria bacterium]|nr:serine/threonine protein kinase [Gammaproteobacteria bacterium]MDH5302997.1 serine/threonine protein kinase [Gammaproteobacteria bacterium]MDH5321256.1 serine/threonine protein kinase [Gammaproteobacteria bacterium]